MFVKTYPNRSYRFNIAYTHNIKFNDSDLNHNDDNLLWINTVVTFVRRWSDDVFHETGPAAVCQAGTVRSLSFGARSAEQNGSGRQTETERVRRGMAIGKQPGVVTCFIN